MKTRLREFITRESVLLAALALIGTAGWIFLEIQDNIRSGAAFDFDERILLFFRVPGSPEILLGPPWIEYAARDLTSLGGRAVLTLVTLAVSGVFLLRRQFQPLILLWIIVMGGTLLMGELKTFYARPRPDLNLRLSGETSLSFPSGHAMMSTMIYMTLAVMVAEFQEGRRMRVYTVSFAAFLAALIGLTRVVLGVHYPSDVIAGWTVGICWALFCWLVAHWLKRHLASFAKSCPPEQPPNYGSDMARRKGTQERE